jgi:glycine oxidase
VRGAGGGPAVVVVGAGIVGCAVAWELGRAGVRVEVVDRHADAREASWAAAGMLAPLAEASGPGPFLELLRAALARFPSLASRLLDETGLAIEYDTKGTVVAALTAEDEAALSTRADWQEAAGLPVRRLSGVELRRLEPAASPEVRGGLFLPEDHQVDARKLTAGLRMAAEAAGARFRDGSEARALEAVGGRAGGIRLAGGEVLAADAVVLAAGAWSARLEGLPSPLPVRPVHGQLAAVATTPGRFTHVLDSPRVYLVPRAGGRLLVGATTEDTGFEKSVTPQRQEALLAAAAELAPELARAPLLESWSGLRPGTPDGLPVLGEDPRLPGLYHASGHYRNGILLGPLTGTLIAAAILGRPSTIDLAHFSVARFG